MMKRMMALLLTFAMILSMFPVQAFAAETEKALKTSEATEEFALETLSSAETPMEMIPVETESPTEIVTAIVEVQAETETTDSGLTGNCGDNLNWTLDDGGTLTISGQGTMDDFETAPWDEYTDQITGVVLSEGVTSIGAFAFVSLVNVTEIMLPESLTAISACAFAGSGVTRLTIPAAVSNIAPDAFYGANLTEISVAENNSVFSSTDVALYSKDMTSLWYVVPACLGVFEVPDGVALIGDYAMQNCTGITGIVLPEGLTSIGAFALENTGICEITVPVSLVSIDDFAFSGLTLRAYYPAEWPEENLQDYGGSVTWSVCGVSEEVSCVAEGTCGENLTWTLDEEGTLTISGEGAMYSWEETKVPWYDYRSSIVKVIIAYDATSIGDYAFNNCTNLTSVSIPDGVGTIGKYAFAKCTGLTEIDLPLYLGNLQDCAFFDCSNLSEIIIPGYVYNIGGYAFAGCVGLTELILPDSVTNLGGGIISGCKGITSLVIPQNVYYIAPGLLDGSSVDGFCVSAENPYYYNDESGVLFHVTDGLVRACEALSGEYVIRASKVQQGAFKRCTNLTSIVIEDGLSSILRETFYGCDALTSVTMADTVTFIGLDAFYGCDKLKDVELSNKLVSIDHNAFSNCPSLKSIALPDTLVYLGTGAFQGCSSLSGHITIPDGVTDILVDTFWKCSDLESVTLPNGLKTIGDHAFQYCSNLASINISETVTHIGNEAFGSCQSLANITIPSSVTGIGDNAFWNCTNLNSITLREALTSVGDSAFYSCLWLTELNYHATAMEDFTSNSRIFQYAGRNSDGFTLNVGSNVTKIPAYLLYNSSANEYATKVTSVVFEDGSVCESIGASAFKNCIYLTSITFTGDAPTFGDDAVFGSVTATAYYPADNDTWTEDVMQNYGGTITWVAYGETEEPAEPEVPDYEALKLDTEATAVINAEGEYAYFTFTPEKTEGYAFYSMSDMDTYGYLYDSQMNPIYSNDDGGEGNNFRVVYTLEANVTYVFGARYYDGDIGSFPVYVTVAHSYIKNTLKEATCNQAGMIQYTCEYCDHSYTEEYTVNHNYVDDVCTNCGEAIPVIEPGDTVELSQEYAVEAGYMFTPTETGYYRFESSYVDSDEHSNMHYNFEVRKKTEEEPEYINPAANVSVQDKFYSVFRLEENTKYYVYMRHWYNQVLNAAVSLSKCSTPESISLNATHIEIYWDETDYCSTMNLHFDPEDSFGDVIWESSDENVILIESDADTYCNFRVIDYGEATLTASIGSYLQASCKIPVLEYPELKLDETVSVNFKSGESYPYLFTVDEGGYYRFHMSEGYCVDCENSHTGYFMLHEKDGGYIDQEYTVYDGGNIYVYQLEADKTYVVYACNNFGCEVTCDVTASAVSASDTLSISHTQKNYYWNNEEISDYVYVTLEPAGTFAPITWTCDNEVVVRLDHIGSGNCNYTIVGEGSAVITASMINANGETVTQTCTVSVLAQPEFVLNEAIQITLNADENIPYLFTPDQSGYYRFSSEGEYCSACDGYHSLVFGVQNQNEISSIDSKYVFYMEENTTYHLYVYNWSGCVFNGTITGSKMAEPTSISLSESARTFYWDEILSDRSVNVIFSPEDSFETVTWNSSNESVAVISYQNGVYCNYRILGIGETTITATAGDLTASYHITVQPIPEIYSDNSVSLALEPEVNAVYQFTPAESGYYCLFNPNVYCEMDSDTEVFDMEVYRKTEGDLENTNCVSSEWNSDGYTRVFYLEENVTYYIYIRHWKSHVLENTVTLSKAAAPESIDLGSDRKVFWQGEDNSYGLNASFAPANAFDTVSWESSDPAVVVINYTSGTYCDYSIVDCGTATITATAGSGASDSMTITVFGVNEMPEISEGDTEITISASYETVYYRFTPEVDGYYFLTSNSDMDTYAALYDGDMNYLTDDDDGGEDMNFKLGCQMEVGKTYVFAVRFLNEEIGVIPVTLTKAEQPTGISLNRDTWTIHWNEDEYYETLDVVLEPTDSYDTILWSCEGDAVEITYSNNNYCAFQIKKFGEATITATTGNGLNAKCVITVVEMPVYTIGQELEVELSSYDYVDYKLTVEESGYYAASMGSYAVAEYGEPILYFSAEMLDSENNHVYGDVIFRSGTYTRYFYLETGVEYTFRIRNYFDESLTRTVCLSPAIAITEITLAFDTRCTYWDGSDDTYGIGIEVAPEGAYSDVVWTSSDENVVLIVYGNAFFCEYEVTGPGTATVTATAPNGVSAQCRIEVLSPIEMSIGKIETLSLETDQEAIYTFTPDETGYYVFNTEAQDESSVFGISIVDPDGNDMDKSNNWNDDVRVTVVKLEADKTYRINYWNYYEYANVCEISVAKAGKPTEFTLWQNAIHAYLDEGETYVYNVGYEFEPVGTWADVTFTSDNEDVAVIGASDFYSTYLELVGIGEATITVTAGDIVKTIPVTVVERPDVSELLLYNRTGLTGDVVYVYAGCLPEGSRANVTWSIADPSIASFISEDSTSCQLQLKNVGSTTLTATDVETNVSATCTVTVKEPQVIQVGYSGTVEMKDPYDYYYYSFTPEETNTYCITSSDPLLYFEVETVDGDWVYHNTYTEGSRYFFVELEKDVTYVITALPDDGRTAVSADISLTVAKTPDSIALDHSEITSYYHRDDYVVIPFNVLFSEVGSWSELVWESSNEEVVSFDYGYNNYAAFRVMGLGTAEIIATTKNGKSASCTVQILEPIVTTSLSIDAPEYALVNSSFKISVNKSAGNARTHINVELTGTADAFLDAFAFEGSDFYIYSMKTGELIITITDEISGLTATKTVQIVDEIPEGIATSGQCGDKAYWSFNEETGILTITGEGAMYDYTIPSWDVVSSAPWTGLSYHCVVIEEGITHIGAHAFRSSDVTEVTIPATVTVIGDGAFDICSGLTEIELYEGLVSVGNGAFSGCGFATIIIPSTVTSIGDGVFAGSSLTEITFTGNAPTFGNAVFNKVTATAYYPAGNATWTEEVLQNYGGEITWVGTCFGEHTAADAVIENDVSATCTEAGSYDTVIYCAVCGEELSRETTVVPALGHDYVSVVTAATCTEKGYTTYTCSVCGDSYVADYVDALGHTEGKAVREKEIAATCITAGSYDTVIYCAVCGEELSRETTVVPALGHDYVSVVTAATCTEKGYTTHTCQVCGDYYKDTYVVALGHKWDAGKITKAATLFTTGVKTYTCGTCKTTKTETVSKLAPAKPYKITNVVSGVHVYWTAIDGVAKYGLWRSETGANGTYKWLANPTVAHFTDTTAESGKTYYYKVTAMNATGVHSEKSPAIGVTYVSTPDITSRINKAAGITVGWEKITGATGYAIYRKSYGGTDAWVRVATIEGNTTFTWTDSSVKNNNGTVYKYTIRALAGSDMKTLSGCRNAGRTMARLTSRTLNSATKANATSIKCQWTTSSAVTGYEVRFMVGDQVYKTFTVGNYKTGVKTFTGLKAGQTYKIQVRSYLKVDGMGFYSAWSTAKNVTL